MSPYFKSLTKYWYIVVIIVVVTTVLTLIISMIQVPKYESMVQLLIVQKQTGGMDATTATRSADTIGHILSKAIYTSTFFDSVMKSGFDIDKTIFPEDLKELKKVWKKTVESHVISDTGILEIRTYHKDRYQTEQLAYGVAYVITSKGSQYHGGGGEVEIKMIDKPLTSERPEKPNVLQNTAVGFVLSILASLGIIFLLTARVEEVEVEKKIVKKEARPVKAGVDFVKAFRPEVILPTPPIPPPKRILEKPKVEKILKEKERPRITKEVDEYSPERVDRWIKTGKFEE